MRYSFLAIAFWILGASLYAEPPDNIVINKPSLSDLRSLSTTLPQAFLIVTPWAGARPGAEKEVKVILILHQGKVYEVRRTLPISENKTSLVEIVTDQNLQSLMKTIALDSNSPSLWIGRINPDGNFLPQLHSLEELILESNKSLFKIIQLPFLSTPFAKRLKIFGLVSGVVGFTACAYWIASAAGAFSP